MFINKPCLVLGTLVALLASGPFTATQAPAQETQETQDHVAQKSRFDLLSQHGNVECSVQFEKSIATMPPDARLQGSCCAPMDEARYRQQIRRAFASTPTLPKSRLTLTTFQRPWRTSSWATTT